MTLAKRGRFYQSLIDGELLNKGKPYEEPGRPT